MKRQYIGVKSVHAEPKTYGEHYREHRKIGQPPIRDLREEGYEVTYDNGYVSWCPKVEFEQVNIAVGRKSKMASDLSTILCRYLQPCEIEALIVELQGRDRINDAGNEKFLDLFVGNDT